MRRLRSPRLWDLDTWEELWSSLRRNRLRTFLTACGVFWGMLMLTLLLGFGAGLQHGVSRDFMGLARQSVYVRSDRTMMAYQGQGPGRQIWLTNDDMEVVKGIPGVMFVAPRLFFGDNFGEGQNVVAGTKTGNFFVIATTPEFAVVEAIELLRGRYLDQGDVTEERKVAVIGRNVRRVLFGDENPVGSYVSFRGVFFRVVGETRSMRSGQQADRQDNAVYLPLATAQRAYNKRGIVAFASVSLLPDAPDTEVQHAVMERLKKRHHVHPDDPQGIRSFNVAEEFRRITTLFVGIRVFVWFVGVATLLAGVLGVSNILLITVKERTRELGIRKALGATPSSILRMVMAESLVLTSLAGYGGIVVGVAVLELASRVTQGMPQAPISDPEVDMKVVLAAGAILILGGLLAAIMPARHATRIHPVEALRAE
jgi:putative ABC transport system permease protein